MPPFRDEHILIIAPGSQVTLAQLGLPESFTPARFRFPTRMFPAEKKGEYEPYKIRERRQEVPVSNGNGTDAPKEDVEMKDAESAQQDGAVKTENESSEQPENAQKTEGQDANGEEKQETTTEIFYEEDVTSDEGAVYPIQSGRIVDWPCFFALLTHVYNTLSPPFHTPIMLISEPAWSARDRETITQFVFEKFKTPAFCLMDSALAVCYGYGTSTATVVDVGKDKVNVTAVTDFLVNEHGRGIALEGCGGDYMTDRIVELLGPKGFTREMCEQLKRSNITELLPPGTPLPGAAATARQGANPAASASTGTKDGNAPNENIPRGPGEGTQTGGEGNGEADEDEGVLDVAAIVSGNTSEFLANREKEKAEKASTKKGATDQSGKPLRLPNSKKEKASFQFEEYVRIEPEKDTPNGPGRYMRQSREIEVGVERFLAATPKQNSGDRLTGGLLEDIATQIHHTILAVPDATKRSELWDSLIVVGNGSKIKGFTQSLLGTITQKYILSPSATMFTSEIPSNFSTPLPTGGTNTPAPSGQAGPMNHPAGHGVNPLLVAATHANNPMPGTPSMDPAMSHHRSTGHSQTPTSVKTLRPPEYFPEWKEQSNTNAPGAATTGGPGAPSGGHGMEEAVFLGAQVASKVVFVIDQGVSKGFMSRVEYNENGPSAIHEYTM
ncbi:chromatin remodeling complex subunit [Aspergillus piperis CBS 112811]|uniref:Chromatin remodeling complex subunit n=1 Tax=Aspergillus piperis CBS 112811 TaxID=1448313 RepID=A0A8G1R3B5_9EURO|nr:chromatin remodeling complex subunit [Aspergillus piperis CBS 112811]RAH58813.1 chromatin remodeling complex subunit [Aspergillus piperis CBS 112811]